MLYWHKIEDIYQGSYIPHCFGFIVDGLPLFKQAQVTNKFSLT